MRAILPVILGMLLIGCAHQAPPSVTALPDRHEDWFIQKAVALFEAKRAQTAGPLSADYIPKKDFDRSIPVKTEWADDKRWIIVSLPTSVTKFREEWFEVQFDTRTGEVMGSGPSFVIVD